jgi:hypothetical protein
MTEQEAHEAILQWCRNEHPPRTHPAMRVEYGSEIHKVIDMNRYSDKPEHRYMGVHVTMFEGATWLDIAEQMGLAPKAS